MQKIVHPTSWKPERATWEKWVSRWAENPKGRSRQKLRIKSVWLCPVGSPQSTLLPRSEFKRSKISPINFCQREGAFKDIGGNSRVGTRWDHFHMAIIFSFTLYFFSFFRRFPLTMIFVSLYKNSYSWAKYQYQYTLKCKLFVFVLSAKTSND